ncbi:MAG: hypothetical protein FJX77_03220, partial [Armatimonadetes bacterium]|nr:hypothetical protein [Armatimonadota bacterium]
PLRTPRLHFVLLRPPVAVITGWAYRRWDPARNEGGGVREFVAALETGEPERIAPLLRNDIEPGVVSAVPEVRDALAWLRNQGLLGARMTGSGSVVFGIARDAEHAAEVAARPGAPGELWTAQSAVGRLGADDE